MNNKEGSTQAPTRHPVDFNHSDVVRHPLVSKIVKAYSDQEND